MARALKFLEGEGKPQPLAMRPAELRGWHNLKMWQGAAYGFGFRFTSKYKTCKFK